MLSIGAIFIALGILIPLILFSYNNDAFNITQILVILTLFVGIGTFLIILDKGGDLEQKLILEYETNVIPGDIKNPNEIVLDVYDNLEDDMLTKSVYTIQKWETVNSRKGAISGEETYYILVGKYNYEEGITP